MRTIMTDLHVMMAERHLHISTENHEDFILALRSMRTPQTSNRQELASMGAIIWPPKAVALQNLAALQDNRL